MYEECHRPKPDKPCYLMTTPVNLNSTPVSLSSVRLAYISLDCLRLAFILVLGYLVKKNRDFGSVVSRLVIRRPEFRSSSCQLFLT